MRVVAYHAAGSPYGATWFTSMPLMFFIAGYFMEQSLARTPTSACIRRRFRRVLIPLAPFSALAMMLYWRAGLLGNVGLWHAATFFLPFLSYEGPVGPVAATSELGWTYVGLWYLQSYLWFVLMSPALRWVRQQSPIGLILGLGALWATGLAVGVGGRSATYLSAWTLGMAVASTPGLLAARSGWGRLAWGAGLSGTAVFVALAFTESSVSVGMVRWATMSVALLGATWIGAALWGRPALDQLARRPAVELALGWLNQRAVSVYLWHFAAFGVARWLVKGTLGTVDGVVPSIAGIAVVFPLTIVLATAAGPMEDLAARRRRATRWAGTIQPRNAGA